MSLEREKDLHPVRAAQTRRRRGPGEGSVHERPAGLTVLFRHLDVPVVGRLRQMPTGTGLDGLVQFLREALAREGGATQAELTPRDGAGDVRHARVPVFRELPDRGLGLALSRVVLDDGDVRTLVRVLEILAETQVSHHERRVRVDDGHLEAAFGLELAGSQPLVVATAVVEHVELLLQEPEEQGLHEGVGVRRATHDEHHLADVAQMQQLSFGGRVVPQFAHVPERPFAAGMLAVGRGGVVLPGLEHLIDDRAVLERLGQRDRVRGAVGQAVVAGQHVERSVHEDAEVAVQICRVRVELDDRLQQGIQIELVLIAVHVAQVDGVQDRLDLQTLTHTKQVGGEAGGRRVLGTPVRTVLIELVPTDSHVRRHFRQAIHLRGVVLHEVDEGGRAQVREAHHEPGCEHLVRVPPGVGGHHEAPEVTLIVHHCLQINGFDELNIIADFG